MSNENRRLLGEVAQAMVPSVMFAKQAYHLSDEKADTSLGLGVLAVDKAFQTTEAMTLNEWDEFNKKEYRKCQVCILVVFPIS